MAFSGHVTWDVDVDWDASGRYSGYAQTVLADSPVGYWRLGEASGTVAVDLGSGGNNGTYVGGPTLGVAGALTGDSDTGVTLNGTTQYIDCSGGVLLQAPPMTFEMWVNPAVSTPVGLFDSGANQSNIVRNYPAGKVEWWNSSPQVTLGLSAGVWQHIVFVCWYDATFGVRHLDYYRNGVLVSAAQSLAANTIWRQGVILGNINGGTAGWFGGSIDEVAIYNTALSAARILAHYNAGLANSSRINAYVLGLSIDRGRAAVNDDFAAGDCRLTVNNNDGRFNPFYAAGPIAPNVLPGRKCRVQATFLGVTYPQWVGRISPSGGKFGLGSTLEYSGLDAFEDWRKGRTNTALQTNKRVDQIIGAILNDISWPAGDRTLDTAQVTLDQFTNHNRLPLNALQLAAQQEMEGGFWVGKDGKAVFRSRYYRSGTTSLVTLTRPRAIEVDLRLEDLVETAKVTYTAITTDVANTVVYTAAGSPRKISPGDTTWDFDYKGLGVSTPITPVVGTDLITNTQPDGSGTNQNAQLTVKTFTPTSAGATITVTSAAATPFYLTTEQARGLAITGSAATVTATVAAPLVTGNRVEKTLDFMGSRDSAQGYANWLAATRGTWQPRVTVRFVPNTDALMIAALNADIWSRVTISDTSQAWSSQINGDYLIEHVSLTAAPANKLEVSWILFPADMSAGNLFRISGAVGGGQDYSKLLAAGQTGARIAW